MFIATYRAVLNKQHQQANHYRSGQDHAGRPPRSGKTVQKCRRARGKPFRDLGEVSGESCQTTVQDSPPNLATARKRMQIRASYMKANAVLLHDCQIVSGVAGCYQQAVCRGSALNVSSK
ncbi:Rcs stress response system protein RcsF [Serratia ureilytica]